MILHARACRRHLLKSLKTLDNWFYLDRRCSSEVSQRGATIVEMGPRDGLQNESSIVSTADKIELVDRLSKCGFRKIEVTSFVSPKWVPQMSDAAEVMAGITREPGVSYSVLTPNLHGFLKALDSKADEVAVFGSASEGFSQANINATIDESLTRFLPVMDAAKDAGIPVRGYVSCITDCPYDGPVPPDNVARVTEALLEMGCFEVSLGDTIGHGTIETVSTMLDSVLNVADSNQLAGHFHDTHGRALENIEVCVDRGLRTFDSSIGGLGGCPYAPGAKGNVATESVVKLMHKLGLTTGIDLTKVDDLVSFAKSLRSAT